MQPHKRSRPAEDRTATSGAANLKLKDTLASAADNLSHLQRRVLIDALLDAWGIYWERRARAMEAARPVPGDYTGNATREELSAQWRRLTEVAAACRARAQVSPLELAVEDVDDVLGEVS